MLCVQVFSYTNCRLPYFYAAVISSYSNLIPCHSNSLVLYCNSLVQVQQFPGTVISSNLILCYGNASKCPLSFYDGITIYMYVCTYVCIFIKLHITARSGPVILVILCHSHRSSQGGINDTCYDYDVCMYVLYVCMHVCMVITYSEVWINRVRLSILLVVS